MAKAKHPDIVAMFEQQESRQLTMPESINRYLMKVEQGAIGVDTRSEFVASAATHFSVSDTQVESTLQVQADTRVQALTANASRLKALMK